MGLIIIGSPKLFLVCAVGEQRHWSEWASILEVGGVQQVAEEGREPKQPLQAE